MMKQEMINVSLVGASGYAGGELLRLLLSHPNISIANVVSETYAGTSLSKAFPGMRFSEIVFSSFNKQKILDTSQVVFYAQDHGVAMKQSADLLAAGLKVIDLSADFRLKNPEVFREWYKQEHCAKDALKQAVYGLPELCRDEIKSANLIANPGCYPTAAALALIPLLKNNLVDISSIIIDAKSGVSGAGRGKHSLDFHFPELNENFRAYGVAGTHRHTPEIEQTLSFAAGKELAVSFTPHLLPITRGILASCYANLIHKISVPEIIRLYREAYSGHPFVFILEEGQLPSTKACFATNQCHIGIAVDARTNRVSVFSAIDNLIKGAAGQAIQNFNLMSGIDETTGLSGAGIWP